MTSNSHQAIAVIGMGCHYPGAKTLPELWENILTRRQQFRQLPQQRFSLADYYDPNLAAPDKTYGTRAAIIDGFAFDWRSWRIPKITVESTDIVHWLALDVALKALADASYTRESVSNERSGVILGNTLTGEHTRANTMRLRWPYVKRALRAATQMRGLSQSITDALVETMEEVYQSVFAATTEDTLAGGLSNTIAGRICNFLNWQGGGYTVDGACSSSLIAVATAATALVNGDLDLALAGGVDVSLDPFELIGFAKTSALTPQKMSVYDRQASGFIPGEGCGFVVLKRLEDAKADGDYVYAVLHGWGISSDGKGGITAPSSVGQAKALHRAYDKAGYHPHTLNFIEGHGTGTPVGDRAELEGITLTMNQDGEPKPRSVGITSFKSIVGHTKAAAGVGGLIKTIMAVNQRVIPPTAGCPEPNSVFEKVAQGLYPILQGEIRHATETLKAGVSAMGFGGINCHVTLASGDAPAPHLKTAITERALLVSSQDSELFVLSANNIPLLKERLRKVKEMAEGMSIAELTDLAAKLAQELNGQPEKAPARTSMRRTCVAAQSSAALSKLNECDLVRAAIVAGTPDELRERLQQLGQMLSDTPPAERESVVSPQKDIWIGHSVQRNQVAFLFPGQGSQKLNMARTLVERYAWARELVERVDNQLNELGFEPISQWIYRPLERAVNREQIQKWARQLARTEVTQPAICLASLLWQHYLHHLGIQPVAVAGHSLGELTAFQAAGAFDDSALIHLAAIRGRAMSAPGDKAGTMLSLSCSQNRAQRLVQQVDGFVVVANINSPNQTVISGTLSSIDIVKQLAIAQGIQVHHLPVTNAFHSQMVAESGEQLRQNSPIPETMPALSIPLFSSINGQQIQPGLNLRDHFANQVTAPVNFIALVQAIANECDLLVEVGPGRVLSELVSALNEGKGPACFPLESKPETHRELNIFLGSFFVHGGNINWEALYENRLIRPFIPASEKVFIDNPCERPFPAIIAPELAVAESFSDTKPPTFSSTKPFKEVANYKQDGNGKIPNSALAPLPINTAATNAQMIAPSLVELDTLLVNLALRQTGYPLESIKLDSRLLDDLNLDSIKAGELIATAAKQAGVAGQLDPTSLTNATLAEVVAVLEKARTDLLLEKYSESVTSANLETPFNWVRNYEIEYVPQVAPQREAEDWSKAQVLLVSETDQESMTQALTQTLLCLGAQVKIATYQNIAVDNYLASVRDTPMFPNEFGKLPCNGGRNQPEVSSDWKADLEGASSDFVNFSHYLAVLPQTPSKEPDSLPLQQMCHRLKSITTPLKARQACVAYLQWGDGRFGSGERPLSPEVCCAAAFARSLHLEQPDLRVRVVDFAKEISPQRAAQLAIAELAGSEALVTVGYDAAQVRFVPQAQLQQPARYKQRSLSWSKQDVILVTGGAKGITAKCALAVAQSTGVKMALVGRSPAEEGEVVKTLRIFQAEGLICRYYSYNLSNANAVAHLIQTITAELGRITGVIHGAGLNTPRRVEQVSLEDAVAEVTPKLLGANYLLQALAATPPKLFIALSSIIGVTGMPGNTWYAFANESLTILLRRFELMHPQTQVLSLAYSVWGEVGMGVRLGSVKNLERMGIGMISTQEGVNRFLQLFNSDPGVQQVIITSRLGGLDTWNPVVLPPASYFRFIERVLEVEPKVAVKVRAHLSLERDRYIQDHLWRGSYLFPTVFGLEAMAQVTAYVLGEAKPSFVRLEDISLRRPIVVNPTTGVEIEIHAEVMEVGTNGEQRVTLSIRTEQTGFTTDHFTATLVLGEPQLGERIPQKLGQALALAPQTELYGDLLFQGQRFQRIGSIFSLNEKNSIFLSTVKSSDEVVKESFAPAQNGYLLLGDPYFRDVLLQSVQLTIPQHICLPVQIDQIEFFQNPSPNDNSRIVTVLLQRREGQEYISEVFATDKQGSVVERLTGYRLRILEEHPENPTAIELAYPEERDRRQLHAVLARTFEGFGLPMPAVSLGYTPNLQGKSKQQRRDQENPIIAHALRDKLGLAEQDDVNFRVKTLASGKPELSGTQVANLQLSLSHCNRYCLCVVGETSQGCDIELICHRSPEDWIALLGNERASLVHELVQQGDEHAAEGTRLRRDRAGTRVWSALEAVRKACNESEPVFSIVTQEGDSVLLKTPTPEGDYLVVTVPVKLTRPPERMAAIAIQLTQQPLVDVSNPLSDPSVSTTAHKKLSASVSPISVASELISGERHRTRYTSDGPQGQLVYEQRFQASFKDSGSISRRVYFSQYFRWIGQIRELPMESIAPEMLADFLSGDWGMVTNAVSLRILGEATAYDAIQARAWVGNVVESSFDTYIEFCKVLPNNGLERLAIAEVKATWVRLVSYGIPVPITFPPYLQAYLEKFAAKQEATLNLKQPASLPLPPLPASLSHLKAGKLLHSADSGRYGKLLRTEVFQTTLEESNLVGNVYYGNYFIWQGRILDLFLYSVAPEYLRVSHPRGEMICLYTRMDYLREAMPFDQIRVNLYVQSVYEWGAVFNFEFFREQPNGNLEKLHVGQQEAIWVQRQPDDTLVPATWPASVLQALVETRLT